MPSTLTDIFRDDVIDGQTRQKRTRLSSDGPSGDDNALAKQDYWRLFCPHKLKSVNSLLPRQDAHLVAVTDVSRYYGIAFTGVCCSVVVTWKDDVDDSNTVYRTCGQITLSAKDLVNPHFGLLYNTSSVLSGL